MRMSSPSRKRMPPPAPPTETIRSSQCSNRTESVKSYRESSSSSCYSNMRSSAEPTPVSDSDSDEILSIFQTNEANTAPILHNLAKEKRDLLARFIYGSVSDAYELSEGNGRIAWCPTKTRDSVSISHAKGDAGLTFDAAVQSRTNVYASMEEIMELLTTKNTEEFASLEMILSPQEFLDGQVLYTLTPEPCLEKRNGFICVKWHSIKSLAPSVSSHRDYLYVELVDYFTDPKTGALIGFRLSKSVKIDEIPASDTAHLFVRGRTLQLTTVTAKSQCLAGETASLEIVSMVLNDLGEKLPTWLVNKMLDTAALRTGRLRDHLNQKRLDFFIFSRSNEMIPFCKRVCCVICTKSFSFVRRKYNCIACGDVICSQCSIQQLIAQQHMEHIGRRKARVCIQCSSSIREKQEKMRNIERMCPVACKAVEPCALTRNSCSVLEQMSQLARNGHFEEEDRPSWKSLGTAETASIVSIEEGAKSFHEMKRSFEIDLGVGKLRPEMQRSQSDVVEKPSLSLREAEMLQLRRGQSLCIESIHCSYIDVATEEKSVMRKCSRVQLGNRNTLGSDTVGRKEASAEASKRPLAPPPVVPLFRKEMLPPPPPPPFQSDRKPCLTPIECKVPPAIRINSPEPENEFALANIQVHLNRMTEISETLRDRKVFDESKLQTRSSTVNAMAFMAKSQDTNRSHMPITPKSSKNDQFTEENENPLSECSFKDFIFLPDSNFVDSLENEYLADGWKAVHSKTTGKMYFYNESHGATSWTMPEMESKRDEACHAYMVL